MIRTKPILWEGDSAYSDIVELRSAMRRVQMEMRAVTKALEVLMDKKYRIMKRSKMMKARRVTATVEFESTLSISDIRKNILTLFEIYDENKVLKVIQIQLNAIKKEGR